MSPLDDMIQGAVHDLFTETGLTPEALFGEREMEPVEMSPRAAHVFGQLEGAALALDTTVLELLDLWP